MFRKCTSDGAWIERILQVTFSRELFSVEGKRGGNSENPSSRERSLITRRQNGHVVALDFKSGGSLTGWRRNSRLDRRSYTAMAETARSRGSPRLRPGFARVAKKLDPVTVSSASATVSIRFPTFLRSLVSLQAARLKPAVADRPINQLSIRVGKKLFLDLSFWICQIVSAFFSFTA